MQSANASSIEQRLASLEQRTIAAERTARRYRAAFGCVLAVAGAGTLIAATTISIPDVVQARAFEVVSEDGHVVFRASAGERGGQVDIWTDEPQGKNVLRASANANGGDLAIWNTAGENVLGAYTTAAGGELGIWNHTGTDALRASAADTGGMLAISAGANRTLLTLGGGDGDAGGQLTINNRAGAPALLASAAEDGSGAISLNSGAGNPTLTASADQSGAGLLVVHGGDGIPRVTAGTFEGHGVMRMANADGQPVLNAGSNPQLGHGFVGLNNSAGMTVANLSVADDACGRLDLAIDSGQTTFSVDASATKGSAIAMMTPSGQQMLLAGTSDQGGLINLMNEAGFPVFIAGYSGRSRGGSMSVRNGRGMQVLYAGTDTDDRGIVSVSDADGENETSLSPRK